MNEKLIYSIHVKDMGWITATETSPIKFECRTIAGFQSRYCYTQDDYEYSERYVIAIQYKTPEQLDKTWNVNNCQF